MSISGLTLILTDDFKVVEILAFLMCAAMTTTGWHARKFGLAGFRIYPFSKPTAVVSLIFGVVLVTLAPIAFANLLGFQNSLSAIRNLLLLFIPVVISAIAILLANRNATEQAA